VGRLKESARPLFFRVGSNSTPGLDAADDRLGDSLRTHVRSLSVMQKEALVVSRRTGASWRLASDEGAYLDGDDEAPCPLSFVTTGMVGSYMHEILALARARSIEIRNIVLIQDNYYTMQGSALKGTMTGGARDVEIEAQVESPADRDTLVSLLYDATAASPLHGLLRGRHESLFSLTHNGLPVACDRVASLAGKALAAVPDTVFEAAVPAAGDFSDLVRRDGPSPKTHETTGFAGSSLAEHQDRTLHLRGICRRRDDGVKRIEQQLFNPHGSIFHFLCDEAEIDGGSGAAPDAASYLSAGIAFCFMTQLGRYAKIAKTSLQDYRVVQDTHFSQGGASGATGRAGRADPVETHVRLESQEDDAFARRALDMAEQTCFLHALCRTDLKTRIRLSHFDAGSV
jgi:uncharacterized OsmC-like protein